MGRIIFLNIHHQFAHIECRLLTFFMMLREPSSLRSDVEYWYYVFLCKNVSCWSRWRQNSACDERRIFSAVCEKQQDCAVKGRPARSLTTAAAVLRRYTRWGL